ncbi:MAG: hypothetical protein C0425_11240 [Chlorobiaceae bacterium]|nr:hypothetical protein [Chlorobiaceae bacterium]MBA4310889.1 hypothetical protein [Chlorobiaceae bacterium]
MKNKIFVDPLIRFSIIILATIFIFIVLKELHHIFIPFVVAYLLFFLFSPLNDQFKKWKIPIAAIIIINIVIIGFISFGIGRFFVDSIMQFTNEIDSYFNKLNQIVRTSAVSFGITDPYFRTFSLQTIIAKLDYKELAGGFLPTVFDLLGSILFILFFFVFIVGGHDAILSAFRSRLVKDDTEALKKLENNILQPNLSIEEKAKFQNQYDSFLKDSRSKLENTVKEITYQIQKYIVAKIAINLVAGLFVALALVLLKIDFPIIWGLFTFFLNFIPSIGSAVALVLPALMALIQHEQLGYFFIVVAVMAVIQTIFFNIIEPHIIGKRLNLNPIVILLSVLIWGYVWGIVGMLLAVPLTAIIKIIISYSDSENSRFISDLMDQD